MLKPYIKKTKSAVENLIHVYGGFGFSIIRQNVHLIQIWHGAVKPYGQ
jgi:hypothetical protein